MQEVHSNEMGLPISLIMTTDAYENSSEKPIGRRSAGASFLNAYFKYGGNTIHHIIIQTKDDADWFIKQASAHNSKSVTRTVGLRQWGKIAEKTGIFHLPDPCLERWAWRRMPYGDGLFSLLGIVHTLSANNVQKELTEYCSAPLRSWDALICTSRAARTVVEGFLERQASYLRWRHGATRFERLQLPIIPLGIDPHRWTPSSQLTPNEVKAQARTQLNLPKEAELVLIAGRLDFMTKFQPDPFLRVLEDLRQTDQPRLELVVYGEALNDEQMEQWKKAAAQLAPSLPIHWIPGRKAELAAPVRWASDVFVSLADNPQETFGITPLEAMAAGLPCIVSDWDGYRDTVVQPGEADEATGLRIATRLQQGLGTPEAISALNGVLGDRPAIGLVSQGIAVDLDQLRRSLNQLLSSPKQRNDMGAAGQRRVRQLYDWKVVIESWRDLTQELNKRRQHALNDGHTLPPQLPPCRPNTSTGFGCYATEVLPRDWRPNQPPPELEAERFSNPFQEWDKTLLDVEGPRRRGWWLKQGLVKP